MEYNDQVIAEFRRNGGHVGGWLAETPVVLVHHIGARSGIEHVTPLAYQPLGDALVIVGSNGASPVDPAWCHNLRAHPEIEVEVGTRTLRVRAEELDDPLRAEIWPMLVVGAPSLGEYQAKTTRRFPVFLLTPETEEPPT